MSVLKVVSSVQSVMCLGRKFQREKLLRRLCHPRSGAWSCVVEGEVCVGGVEGTGRVVVVEQVGEVWGGLMSEEEYFKLDLLWDREPVEVLEEGGEKKNGKKTLKLCERWQNSIKHQNVSVVFLDVVTFGCICCLTQTITL